MTASYQYKKINSDENDQLRFFDFTYLPNSSFPPHHDINPRISIVLNGKLKEKAGQQEVFAEASSVVIKPGDVCHTNEFGPRGARILSIVLRPELVNACDDPDFLRQWRWLHARQMAAPVTRYLKRLKISDDPMSETLDFIGALSDNREDKKATPPTWLKKVIERIHDEPARNHSVRELAEGAGVHPVYLARVFRKYWNCGVKEYIHRIRLQHIINALSDTGQPLVDVSYQTGYADQSHMSRFFKEATGVSPGVYRRLIQSF